MSQKIKQIDLADEAKRRYLNYALSVVTSRALPDVRDGLKPVQRRILYAMYQDFHLSHQTKYRKSAAVVGRVIGTYHPHGDQSVYNAMVRMAQPFSLRYPLVEGHGNFGSLDGDPAAAYRYTEVRLQKISSKLLEELNQNSVNTKTNFDGSTKEPTILPAQFPALLVNGSSGIAVGMATNIPPHNLEEVIDACLELIKNPDLTTEELLEIIKGPDFPTGGQIIISKKLLTQIYKKGKGSIKIQSTYKQNENQIIINSIPFAINKTTIVEQIASIISENKIPGLKNIRDESTERVRIVLEIENTPVHTVMAYLFHHTQLETNFAINMMSLVPENNNIQPKRLSLKRTLMYFLDFRLDILTNRLTHKYEKLKRRIHTLRGFEIIFDFLEEAFYIIHESKNKDVALLKLCREFGLDKVQAKAILKAKLQHLVRIEKKALIQELHSKIKKAKSIKHLLANEDARWDLLAEELDTIAEEYRDPRRTYIKHTSNKNLTYNPDEYIKKEDTNIVLTKDGWLKRVQHLKDPQSTSMHPGDEVVTVLPGNTSECVAFFSNYGIVYIIRILDIPSSKGKSYGNPIQKFFSFGDGERVVSALSLDKRVTPPDYEVEEDEIPPPYMVAITKLGKTFRFPLQEYRNPTQKPGRKFCRPINGDEIISVFLTERKRILALITKQGLGSLIPLNQISVMTTSHTKGVIAIQLKENDEILNAKVLNRNPNDTIQIKINNNNTIAFGPTRYKINRRAATGVQVIPPSKKFEIVKPSLKVIELK